MRAAEVRNAVPHASGNRADRSSFARQSTNSGGTTIDFAATNGAALAVLVAVSARILAGSIEGGPFGVGRPHKGGQ
jgi:hypothetical protein